MKNYEKYADEIRGYRGCEFCEAFIIPNILKSDNCAGMTCYKCRMLQMLWLLEDYKEPEVDWSKVEVDTPILVRDNEDGKWIRSYFATYDDGVVYAWNSGRTSWSEEYTTGWKCSKLAETEEETK